MTPRTAPSSTGRGGPEIAGNPKCLRPFICSTAEASCTNSARLDDRDHATQDLLATCFNDCPIVLNDPILEQLLSCLHGLRSRLTSPRPQRVPLPDRVEFSKENSLDFETACSIAASYRWLFRHHPDTLLREPDGTKTFRAVELEQRYRDELDWADRVAIGDVVRPRPKRRSVFSDRDFRIRQFVGYMRYEKMFGIKRHEAVDLVAEIARAFPGRYPLSRKNVETILDRRPSDIS